MTILLRLALPASLAALVAVFLGTAATADPGTILKFETMAPVTGPYAGAANPVRGLPGGGLPWMIDGARGSLDRDGRVAVRVNGLVLANRAPVPVALRGTNPIAQMKAIVSCQTIDAAGQATVANVSTGTFPVDKEGDGSQRATVQLPHPCIAPIIFVTSPGGAWFAATGN
ncbi:MAG: hypothetical protein ABI401_13355 [Candidatus Dormibacter sp.]